MQIAYLVHDLNDAAVRRRVALFEAAGLRLRLAGFHRDAHVPATVGSAAVTPLGRTSDGALVQRALSVLRNVLWPFTTRRLTRDADVIVARNLETLVVARCARRKGQRLVYECLDIHRLLLGDGLASRWLHRLEAWALKHVDLVFVSAPAFRDAYFRKHIGYEGDVLLVENLVPRPEGGMPPVIEPPPPEPWVIGWFGMLRCRKTFGMLKALAAGSGGRIEVLIAGRASTDMFDDFDREAAEAPGVRFLGGYTAEDLPRLFGQVHFVWAIDYFEEGLNSVWLLPNRLYESIAHGAVPLALRSVATGEWLGEHGAGILLDDPMAELPALIDRMTAADYRGLRAAVARVPAAAVTMDDSRARAVARTIAGVP
jgi:glycosyltransferase involved in cell wall biosynthesis